MYVTQNLLLILGMSETAAKPLFPRQVLSLGEQQNWQGLPSV